MPHRLKDKIDTLHGQLMSLESKTQHQCQTINDRVYRQAQIVKKTLTQDMDTQLHQYQITLTTQTKQQSQKFTEALDDITHNLYTTVRTTLTDMTKNTKQQWNTLLNKAKEDLSRVANSAKDTIQKQGLTADDISSKTMIPPTYR